MNTRRTVALVTTAIAGMIAPTLAYAAPSAPTPTSPANMIASGSADASAASCYTQLDKDTGVAVPSQNFEAALDAYDAVAADDFRIGETCTISSVQVLGQYFSGAGPAASETVTIYASDLSTVLSTQTVTGTESAGSFTIPITPVTLSPGAYWIAVQVNLDSKSGKWGWDTRGNVTGQQARWQNSGDGYGTGCIDWSVMQSCLAESRPGPDLIFALGSDSTFSSFETPTDAYLDDMCLADPSGLSEFDQVTSVAMPGDTCMIHTVHFSAPGTLDSMPAPLPLQVLQVPTSWPSWGAPPYTESATPTVLYTQGATAVQFDFGASGQYAGTNCKGGLEVQPSGTDTHDYKGEFRDYLGNLLGTVYVSASGNAGARLLGAATTGDPLIKTITVTDISTSVPPTDFAVAQIHDCAGGGAVGNLSPVLKGPNAKYLKKTCSAKYKPAQEFSVVTSVTLKKPAAKCPPQPVTFEAVAGTPLPMQIRRVPGSWATWGAPGMVESLTPYVLSSQGATSALLTYAGAGRKFVGVEIQPDSAGAHVYMAEFRDSASNLIGTMYVTATAPSDARLIAAKVTTATKVKTLRITDISFTVAPSGFALAQVRASKN